MCNETASATTAIATAVPAGKLRITDIVGDNYKEWYKGTRIVFDAGTNSGKTYFILNVLLPWAHEKQKKILYLCNRTPLRDQIRQAVNKLGSVDFKTWDYDFELEQDVEVLETRDKYERTIRVEN